MPRIILDTKFYIFLIMLLYFSLAVFNINYPGLNTDEAFSGVASNNIFRDVSDVSNGRTLSPSYFVILFGKILPIMSAQYYGAVIPYLFYPFIRILGSNSFSLRLGSIFIFAIFLLFVYQFCRVWFGRRAGILATLLTATSLVFVQYSRVALYRCEIFVMLFFWVGLFFLIKYSQKRNYFLLWLSFFFFGLGLSAKINFLYYAAALTLAYLIIGRRLDLLGPFNIKKAIIILVSFCFGSFFIILYNINNPWVTIKQLLSVLTDSNATAMYTSGKAINNWDYFNNLGMRLMDLFAILKGDISARIDWGVTRTSIVESFSPLIASFTIVSLALVLFLALFSRRLTKIIRYRILFLYLIYSVVFFLSPLTLSGFNQGHLMVMLPFPQVVAALFLDYIWDKGAQGKVSFVRIFGWFMLTYILLFNIWTNIYFNIQMKRTGGYGRWSTAIYDLVDYLQKNNITSPVMFGYGLHSNLMFLTDNKVKPEIYDRFYPEPIESAYAKLFSRNNQIFYLALVPEEDELDGLFSKGNLYGKDSKPGKYALKDFFKLLSEDQSKLHRDLFMKYAEESGKKKKLDKVFTNNIGAPVYWLYKIY